MKLALFKKIMNIGAITLLTEEVSRVIDCFI